MSELRFGFLYETTTGNIYCLFYDDYTEAVTVREKFLDDDEISKVGPLWAINKYLQIFEEHLF